MKIAMLYTFLLSAFISFSCTKAQLSANTKEDETPVPTTLNKTLMLKLVNEVRSKGCQCGNTYYPAAPSVLWSDVLEKAAYGHSNDMYVKNYFSHTAPDGSSPGDRIKSAGYNWLAYGENIGLGYTSEKEVVEAWKSSPGHCKNLMNKSFKEVGVSRVGGYWTQAFGAR